MSLRVTVLIPGSAERIGLCRKHINILLDAEPGERYRERHTADRLDYGLTTRTGIPFPPFVSASTEFPELVFSFIWEGLNGESSGRAIISNGCLVDQDVADHDASSRIRSGDAVYIDAASDGTIRVAAALRVVNDRQTVGYAVTAEQHAYFTFQRIDGKPQLMMTTGIANAWSRAWELQDGVWSSALIPIADSIDAASLAILDDISDTFASEWLWFAAEAEVETALERHRFTLHNLAVQPANLRSEKIRVLPRDPMRGIAYSTVDQYRMGAIDALSRCWIA